MLESLSGALLRLVSEGETYVLLLPAYVLLLSGERIAHGLRSERRWNNRDAAANVSITVAYLGLDVLVGHILPVGLMAWLYEHARLVSLPVGAAGWLLAFLLHDLAWYVDHRLSHRVGLLWAMHHVHHSSREYNMTVASRGFLLDNTIARPMFYLLPVLGVSPFHFITLRVVISVFGILQHTRMVGRLPLFDGWLATPSNHRVHHGQDTLYLDRNFGEVLVLWDRLLSTYQRERQEPTFGVIDHEPSYNPLRIETAGLHWLGQQMSTAPRWRDKLRYLWKPPGWSHVTTELSAPAGPTHQTARAPSA